MQYTVEATFLVDAASPEEAEALYVAGEALPDSHIVVADDASAPVEATWLDNLEETLKVARHLEWRLDRLWQSGHLDLAVRSRSDRFGDDLNGITILHMLEDAIESYEEEEN